MAPPRCLRTVLWRAKPPKRPHSTKAARRRRANPQTPQTRPREPLGARLPIGLKELRESAALSPQAILGLSAGHPSREAARGVGYTLIALAPLLWVVIVGGPSSRNDPPGALSGGHYALLLIGLMAWWALSVARRRDTWKRRQIVRESAALSAGDGIPRVVDGTDPDPYPQAALRPRSEAVWGGIILLPVYLYMLYLLL